MATYFWIFIACIVFMVLCGSVKAKTVHKHNKPRLRYRNGVFVNIEIPLWMYNDQKTMDEFLDWLDIYGIKREGMVIKAY